MHHITQLKKKKSLIEKLESETETMKQYIQERMVSIYYTMILCRFYVLIELTYFVNHSGK